MITAIYDLREYGWKHSDTSSVAVIFRKLIGPDKYEIIEYIGEYGVRKNGIRIEILYDLEELYNWLNDNKLL